MPDEILTLPEVALLLKVAEKTVYTMAQRSQLPAFKVRGQWRFKRVDIDRWIELQKEVSRDEGEELTWPLRFRLKSREVLPKAQDTYYKLILAVGPARAGKTAALTELAAKHKWPRVNVNLRLSEKLLELRIASVLSELRAFLMTPCGIRTPISFCSIISNCSSLQS